MSAKFGIFSRIQTCKRNAHRCISGKTTKIGRNSGSGEEAEGRIDNWFQKIRKCPAFYAEHANSEIHRCFFYNIDLQGRLFLEETERKNITTCVKDTKLLNFFFSRIRPTNEKEKDFMRGRGIPVSDYPFVSPCGRELNFIRPASVPIVFHALEEGSKPTLLFGGSLCEAFFPQNLAFSEVSGWLYHRIHLKNLPDCYGLIKSSVAVSLSERISFDESGRSSLYKDDLSGACLQIHTLPKHSEPGVYAFRR